jgi:hypothetical protein
MAIIAEEFEFVVGVDTHARTHTFTAVHASTGAVVDTAAFPATSPGMDRAITWIRRRTGGRTDFAAVEGTSSYGAHAAFGWEDAHLHRFTTGDPFGPLRPIDGEFRTSRSGFPGRSAKNREDAAADQFSTYELGGNARAGCCQAQPFCSQSPAAC